MADQTLDQLPDSLSAEDTDNIYATRNGNSIRMKLAVAMASRATVSRTIATTNGIKGGGDLSANRTLELDIDGLSEDAAPDLASDFVVSHDASTGGPRKVRMNKLGSGQTGSTTSTPDFSGIAVANQTSINAATPGETLTFAQGANIAITTDPTAKTVRWAATGLVPNTVAIGAGPGLSGGGTLTANRSLALDISGQSEDTAPDLFADYVLTHDSSAGVLRKVKLSLLSSATSYTLPTANPTRLGGIRIGNGFTYDESTGILSVAPTGTSYVLPAASTTVRGGIRIGTGFTLSNGDTLDNVNPTAYVLPTAAVNRLGGVKQGQGVDIAADGTITVSTSATGSDNAFRPETYGAIRGTGLTQTQRESNATAINNCWNQASSVKGRIDMGGGTWEVYGPLTLANTSSVRLEGDWCVIRQFQSNVSVVSIQNSSQITVAGLMLAYQTPQTSGSDPLTGDAYVGALRLSGVVNCRFSDIDTRNAWVHIGLSGGTGSFSNTFTNCRINMASSQGWGLIYKVGNGNNFINLRISGGTALQTVSGAIYMSSIEQITFTNLVCEYLAAPKMLNFLTVTAATITGGVFSRLSPIAVAGYAAVMVGSTGSALQIAGLLVTGTTVDAVGQSLTEASLFAGEQGCGYVISNLTVTGTTKNGSPRFCLFGHTSAAAARNLYGTFQSVRLDTNPAAPHRIDELSVATVDPASDTLDGPLLSYNNVLGEVTGSMFTIGDTSLTVYSGVHGRHIQANTPLTAERTVTLARNIDKTYASGSFSAPRTVRGATMRVSRTAVSTGASLLTVANHDGTSIVGLTTNQSVELIFDGTNWTQIPGLLASGSGGGGGTTPTITYATSQEATTGTSTTTVMNPARTKEAFNAFAQASEITGTAGQVLGFDASGNAVAVKLTRAVMVPLVAENVAVTTAVTVRRIAMPISMKLSAVRVFVPAAGTTATTVDVNAAGVSILTAPITVAGNTSTASATTFTSASAGTITQGTVVDFDIDAAGAGAKGLQVTLVGSEV